VAERVRRLVREGGRRRCFWCAGDELYRRYHDEEWGFPVADDRRLFEKVVALDLAEERGSLAAYFWSFEPPPGDRPRRLTWQALRRMSETPASRALSKDLRRRGWTFVGPTTAYAFMQAVGLVNDHLEGCDVREAAARARRRFRPPAGRSVS
jgi:3-methyladenine DNA glycosylase Tag